MRTVCGDWRSVVKHHGFHVGNGDPCEGCDGGGVRAPASPSCEIPGIREPWFVVERCDYCEKYSSDLEAALSIAAVARYVTCTAGGTHVIARMLTSAPLRHHRCELTTGMLAR